jgi:hypothetical protein
MTGAKGPGESNPITGHNRINETTARKQRLLNQEPKKRTVKRPVSESCGPFDRGTSADRAYVRRSRQCMFVRKNKQPGRKFQTCGLQKPDAASHYI